MTTAPILTAEDIIVASFKAALAPYVELFNGRPKAYWWRAEQLAPLDYIIFNPQADISQLEWIDRVGAECLITVKACATKASAARALRNDVTPAMDALSYPGFTITAKYQRTPPLSPKDDTHFAAHIYRVRIERA